MEKLDLVKAENADAARIWDILQQAIERRRLDGSAQWQDGYPNPETIENDLARGAAFVLKSNDAIIAYVALIENDEPAYEAIRGKWIADGPFLVVHRIAIDNAYLGKGYIQKMMELIERRAMKHELASVKLDTNFDNAPMLHLLIKLGYSYCGEVFFRGGARKAFQKKIQPTRKVKN